MRKIKEVLRLNWSQGLSARQIARSCGIARSTVQEFLNRAQVAGLSWPLPPEVDDFILENLLFPPKAPGPIHHPAPDMAQVHKELRRPGVTLQLLWFEYTEEWGAGL